MEGQSWIIVAAALLGTTVVAPGPLGGQDSYDIETRIWTDRGEEPVVRRGERVRIYYRVSRDAYVAVFHVDTDGTAQLVFPRSPEENHYVRGGHDYRLLFPRSPYWSVTDYPGVGYYFVVASPQPFDFSAFRYSHYGSGWDLTQVGRTVYRDPYRAIDDFVAHLIPDWEYAPYALDFLEYRVGDSSYRYPRFLCYDCHGFRPYTAWNPYRYTCLSFRVVIHDHPYYYPRTRYRGSSVVYTRPPVSSGPRFAFKERAEGESGAPMVVSSGGVADRPGVRGDPAPRRPSSSTGSQPSTTRGNDTPGTRGRAPGRSDAAGSGGRSSGGEAAPPRRPSSVLPGRGGTRATPPTVRVDPRPTDPSRVRRPSEGGSGADRPSGSSGRSRPTLQRRPSGGSESASPPSRTPVRPDRPTRRTRPPAARSGGGSRSGSSGGSARPSRPPPRSGGSAGRRGGSSEGSSARPSRGGSGGSGGDASRRPPPRRPSGGGGDDGTLTIEEMASRDRDPSTSVTSLATSSSSRSVPVGSYRPSAGDDDEVEEGRSPAASSPPSAVPASGHRPAAASAPEEARGASPRGSDAVARRSAPSAVVAGASRPSRSEGASRSGEGRPTWVVRGARPAASPARGQAAPRTRGSSSATAGSAVRRGSGGRPASAGSRAVISRSGGSRSSSPAATRRGGEARSSGTARRPSPPPRRNPPGGGGQASSGS